MQPTIIVGEIHYIQTFEFPLVVVSYCAGQRLNLDMDSFLLFITGFTSDKTHIV